MFQTERIFLTAEWRNLVMLNYEVDPTILKHYVPAGVSLDSFHGKTYVSVVGFQFCRTRLLGHFPIPFHSNFDEVNLRFYVRRKENAEDRRGVVFISEVVPKIAIAATARMAFGENYKSAPMSHRIETDGAIRTTEFQWRVGGQWCRVSTQAQGSSALPQAGGLEQFITEHYWGYSGRRGEGCLEYRVSHVPWRVWRTTTASFEGDSRSFYGQELGTILQRPPDSAFVADGSTVTVFRGTRIR